MTENTENNEALPLAVERFVLHWGEMGGQWGVNRSVSQIHALLFLSERPLTADEIADSLKLARSNVSNSIKELLACFVFVLRNRHEGLTDIEARG